MKINGKSENKSLLRFTTAGSVDDGKSTLIGRLLYDSKSIFEDQMEHIVQSGKRLGREELDLSLLTDGLRAEREQGITIDVAYRYFATPARKFIIADTPGHIQYTRNMVTGASTADLAVILVDARKGVLEQTIRHSYIASLLDIRHIIFCINKMDMINFEESIFVKIQNELAALVTKLKIPDAHYIPISAKYGDNVVDRSEKMEWYHGKTFLNLIETIEIRKNKNPENMRFPVQTIIRPHTTEFHDYRGYAGKVISGIYKKGDKVTVLPSGVESTIKAIEIGGKEIDEAYALQSVVLHLEDDVDVSRGDMIVAENNQPKISQEFEAMLCWMDSKPLKPGSKYFLQINSRVVRCVVKEIEYKLDVNTLQKNESPDKAVFNDIIKVAIKTASPVAFDSYKELRQNGGAILIDETSCVTVGACMIQ